MDVGSLLKELTEVAAPSGHEDAMIIRMRAGFEAAGLTASVDPLGNVIVPVRAARPGYPHVLLFAHMDEVGFIVRKIEPEGFIRLQRIGGIPEKCMAGQRLVFLGTHGPVEGAIATKAHHITEDHEKSRVLPVMKVFADIGAQSRQEVFDLGVAVGTPATWAPGFHRRNDVVLAKAIDNRAGCAVLLAVAASTRDIGGGCGVTLIASVQEEFNVRGIIPAVRAIRPDILIGLDIAPANDTPDTRHIGDVALGAGPTIGYYSFHGRGTLNGLIPNPKLARHLEDLGQRHNLPLQRHIFFGGFTDASYAHLEGKGIPGIDLGIPTRYTHSPIESCSLHDVRAAVMMIRVFLEETPGDLNLARG